MPELNYGAVNKYWHNARPSILGPYVMDGCGEFDLVWRNRRIASQRGSVAQRRRRIEQQVVAHLVEVSALENADNKV